MSEGSKVILKGNFEQQCANELDSFMKKTGQKAGFIADEIKKHESECKFSSVTIYRWLDNKQTITLKNWDYIKTHMNRY